MKAVFISFNKWNYLKDDVTYLLDEHVYFCYDFREGFGIVQYNYNTYNFINSNCKNLLKTNIQYCLCFENRFAQVEINNIWYYIDKECNFYNAYKVSFKTLYNEYPNMRSELIKIIEKYTYFDIEEYFI